MATVGGKNMLAAPSPTNEVTKGLAGVDCKVVKPFHGVTTINGVIYDYPAFGRSIMTLSSHCNPAAIFDGTAYQKFCQAVGTFQHNPVTVPSPSLDVESKSKYGYDVLIFTFRLLQYKVLIPSGMIEQYCNAFLTAYGLIAIYTKDVFPYPKFEKGHTPDIVEVDYEAYLSMYSQDPRHVIAFEQAHYGDYPESAAGALVMRTDAPAQTYMPSPTFRWKAVNGVDAFNPTHYGVHIARFDYKDRTAVVDCDGHRHSFYGSYFFGTYTVNTLHELTNKGAIRKRTRLAMNILRLVFPSPTAPDDDVELTISCCNGVHHVYFTDGDNYYEGYGGTVKVATEAALSQRLYMINMINGHEEEDRGSKKLALEI